MKFRKTKYSSPEVKKSYASNRPTKPQIISLKHFRMNESRLKSRLRFQHIDNEKDKQNEEGSPLIIMRPITQYATHRHIIRKPSTNVKKGYTKRLHFLIQENKYSSKIIIINLEGVICYLSSNTDGKLTVNFRADAIIGLRSISKFFTTVLISRYSEDAIKQILNHFSQYGVVFDGVYSHKPNTVFSNYDQIYKDFHVTNSIDVIVIASQYPLCREKGLSEIYHTAHEMSTSMLPYSTKFLSYPIIFLVNDPRFNDNSGVSLFMIWKQLIAIGIKCSYTDFHKHHTFIASDKNEEIRKLMDAIHWINAFEIVKREKDYCCLEETSIDSEFIKLDSTKARLSNQLLGEYVPKSGQANKKFLTDPMCKEFNTKANDEIRLSIADYGEKFRQRRRKNTKAEYKKHRVGIHRIIFINEDDMKSVNTIKI